MPSDAFRPPNPSDAGVPFALRMKARRASSASFATLPDADGELLDADRLRAQGRWEELIESLLGELQRTEGAAGAARIFVEMAVVFREGLNDANQALDALIEAWQLDPAYAETVGPLEELARAQGRFPELFAVTEKLVAQERDRDRALALYERMVWWLTFEVPTVDLAAHYAERIRILDSTHSAVHIHQATVFRGHSDDRRELEELDRAALSARRPEDRARLHVIMAERRGGGARLQNPSEARRHLSTALGLDPRNRDALVGLEAILQRDGDMTALVDVLEKHVQAAANDAERIDVLRRLAEVYEHHLLKPDKAAGHLQVAFSLDPHDAETLLRLERCYGATRAWPDLANALELAAMGDEEPLRTTSLRKLAEVQESRQADVAAAVRTYERLARLWPGDEGVLGELARLSEKAGDWRAAAKWRGELAEVTPAPAVRARMHVAAGQLLASPDREPLVARVHFEKAVECDPTSEAAWTALLCDARQTADYRRMAHYLKVRSGTTDAGRAKGQIFVELADIRRLRLDDENGAIQAYEAARNADPNNETAARALLELYAVMERWEEADPLCERVAIAAERDGDLALLVATLRIARRIALAFHDERRALRSALKAFELKPDAEDVRSELVDSLYALREDPRSIEPAKDAIGALVDTADALPAARRAKLGMLLAGLQDSRATLLFESALALDEFEPLALEGLCRTASEKGQWAKGAAYGRRHARTVGDPEERFSRLVSAAETFRKAEDLEGAAATYEEAHALLPSDHQILHALLAVYQQLERWENVTAVLRLLAEGDPDRGRKSKTLFAMGQIARDKLDDAARAIALFEEALDFDPTRLEAFERVVRLETERRDWAGLAESYRRMLARLPRAADAALPYTLYHQLGLIYRDRLHEHDRAVEAFRSATECRPDSQEDQTILRELLSLGGRVEDAVALAHAQALRDPLDPGPYHPLFALLMQNAALDRAWCVGSILHHLGALGDAEAPFYRAHVPPPLGAFVGSLDASVMPYLFHPDLDVTLTAIFEIAAPAIVDVRIAQLSWRDRVGYPGPALSADVAAVVDPMVARVSAVLGVATPRLYERPTPGPAVASGATRPPSLLIGTSALAAMAARIQPFFFGKRVFETVPALYARALCPTITELSAVLGALARIVSTATSSGRPGARASTPPPYPADEALRSKLQKSDIAALAELFDRARAQGASTQAVERWSQLADMSTSRAGFVLVGDLELARSALVREPLSPADLSAREQMRELVVFALSDTYIEIRRRVGVSLGGR